MQLPSPPKHLLVCRNVVSMATILWREGWGGAGTLVLHPNLRETEINEDFCVEPHLVV